MVEYLPIATENDLPSNVPQDTAIPVDAAVSALADTLADLQQTDPTNVRIGAITSVSDPTSANRVQTSITGTSWISRTADASLRVGDRVWIIQQGPQFIVGGRLSGTDAFTPIGAMMPFAGSVSTPPTGWLSCDGSAVSRTTYAVLYAVVGTTYGAGNGTTTFNLPNLQNRVPVGSGSSYTRGQTGGTSTVTLTDSQMPSHGHSLSVSGSTNSAGSHSHGGSTDSDGGHSHSGDGGAGSRSDLLASGGSNAATPGTGSTSSAGSHNHGLSTDSGGSHSHTVSVSGSVGSAGSDAAHENMQPFVAMPYIIRAL